MNENIQQLLPFNKKHIKHIITTYGPGDQQPIKNLKQKYKSTAYGNRYIRQKISRLKQNNKSRIVGNKNKTNTTKEPDTSTEAEIKHNQYNTHMRCI